MKKTAHYRHASHFQGENMFLQTALNACQDNYPPQAFPVFQVKPDVDCIVAKHNVGDGRDFLHLVTYERGAGAAVVATINDVTVNEQPAPVEKEFIQSQLFLMVSGDNLLWTTHNMPVRDRAVGIIINELVKAFGGFDASPMYVFEATLNEDRFRAMMEAGIEEIDLALGDYKDTFDYLVGGEQLPNAGLFSMLKSTISNDVSAEDREAASKIRARIALRPGRDWKDFHVKQLLADMARNVLDEMDDGFVIVTKSGLRVTHDSMRVKDDFNVDGNRRVVSVNQIETELHASFGNLIERNVIERL